MIWPGSVRITEQIRSANRNASQASRSAHGMLTSLKTRSLNGLIFSWRRLVISYLLSFPVQTFSSTGLGPVAQAVERWTPCGGSARAAYKVRGLRRDGRSTIIGVLSGMAGLAKSVSNESAMRGPAVRGYESIVAKLMIFLLKNARNMFFRKYWTGAETNYQTKALRRYSSTKWIHITCSDEYFPPPKLPTEGRVLTRAALGSPAERAGLGGKYHLLLT